MGQKQQWYVIDPDEGISVVSTEAGARSAAETSLDGHADDSPDGWHENMPDLEWGRLVPMQVVQQTNTRPAPEGSEFDYLCDYVLVDAQPIPGRAALTQAIRAFTVDMPNDEPNGARERQLEVLGQALERGDLRTARKAYGFMCEAGADDLKALRVAAEECFGGDFRAPQAPAKAVP